MAKTGFVTVSDASETQKGVSRIATAEEAKAGTLNNAIITPKTLSDALGSVKFGGLQYHKFVSFTQMQPNFLYVCVDPAVNPPAEVKLPARGVGQAGDLIIVYNITEQNGVSFKVTLNEDLVLHHDGQIIDDVSGKFLLGNKGGSCVLLGCGGNQQWFSLLHYQITVSSA